MGWAGVGWGGSVDSVRDPCTGSGPGFSEFYYKATLRNNSVSCPPAGLAYKRQMGTFSKFVFFSPAFSTYVTCSAILALLDKDADLRARHELLNTERIL